MMKPLLTARISSMSLGRRFALSFASILALLIGVTAVSQVLLSGISGRMKSIVEINNHQMALATRMIDQVNEMAITVRTVTLLTVIKDIDAQVAHLKAVTAGYMKTEQELAEALKANSASAQENELINKIQSVRAKTLPLMAEAAKLGSDGATPEATILLMKEVLPVELEWRKLVGELIALQTKLNDAAYAEARQTENAARFTLIAVCAVAVAIGGFLAWSLTRSVVAPVAQAIRITERIAQGNLSSRIPTGRGDELGRLLTAVGSMQERLKGLVGDIRHSAESISSASTEIASGNHNLSQRTEQQSASLQKTASSMSQLTGTVQHNAESARQADQLASSASSVGAPDTTWMKRTPRSARRRARSSVVP